jgi:hypothetical protein
MDYISLLLFSIKIWFCVKKGLDLFRSRFVILVTIGVTEIVSKGPKKSVKNTREAFNRFCTKDSCTRDITHNKCYSLKLEVVGCTSGSRGEVPGEREPVIR